jgi:hypothetical protein
VITKASGLLIQYLEGVSWRVMEAYPELVRRLIRGRSGLYALYRRDKLYYVGLASNLMGRLKGHLRDRHKGFWDRFSVYLTSDAEHIKELESLLLRIVAPKGNRVRGKFGRAADLYRSMYREMADSDAKRRAHLLGGVAERRLRRRLTRGSKGAKALAGLSAQRIPLRGRRDGVLYRASLLRTGQVRYRGRLYPSPTAAARAALGRTVNGWWFWRFNNHGKWQRLRTLRG